MSILKELGDINKWQSFLAYKIEKSHLTRKEEAFFKMFIESEAYKPLTDNILKENFCFSIPQKKLLNKHGIGKKRTVYTFSEQENMVLKLIAHLLYRYDGAQPHNCYSFRRDYGAKRAIATITKQKGIAEKYACKLDIKNYFNSIDVTLLLPILHEILSNDNLLYRFFEKLLTVDKAQYNDEIITEKRGAMAGTPISQFFANVYLAEMDRYFGDADIPYARYSDDIIFFADSEEMIAKHLEAVSGFLAKYHVEINPEKVQMTAPGEKWDYLGVAFNNGCIELSAVTMKKIKGKIRRKARSIYRWKIKKKASDEKAMSVFAKAINKKFFGKNDGNEFTWARWFFPLISTDHDLKLIDAYAQEHMRYIASGCFNKTNYKTRYSKLKGCGYRSLVNEYYRYHTAAQSILR